jgi:hypothetical protein
MSLIFDDPAGDTTLSLYDGLGSQFNIRPYMSGQLTKNLGFTANFETTDGGVQIMDAIAQIKVVDEFQVWVGQHIPANDRNNMNGPFFANGWTFPITVQSYPFDVAARDRGVTTWGLINGGMLKYHVSMVDLQPEQAIDEARFAGRVTLHLLEPEAFYYNSGTYFGAQDVLAIGAVAQYQKGSEGEPDPATGDIPELDNDFVGFSFDAFFEKNLGSAGTVTAEAGYWNFDETGADYVVNQGTVNATQGFAGPLPGQSYMGALSWLTPNKIGIGQIQVNGRVQAADIDGADAATTVDLGLAYVIDGFNHKYHLNYRHADASVTEDSIQFGVQYQIMD